ncbi:Pex7p KNAG_0I00920 [Huiozyma naganishii CBS 8797]|uniref:Peroxin-7 n=1 Tax=Huiozyma naganishii (strain ATCC MYA-139 / BCRC 22969 / CBS 8797 / KCTC 17520 / NBRC 10181 / NCYC 3082 / Yp74L-3) TaxID=1071383 RepID=J7RQ38_HUIN7|nr:hypothetical protein KNAG_0I00920 [Kazachstania naganishii CBS 8797]CCK71883.1 hypothetical protein KNAG_0I00920 [Kazachstania naganishii CBS 8797]
MLRFEMRGFSGYAVQYSPFLDSRLAVATGTNYGLIGNGKLWILDISPEGQMVTRRDYLTQDCLFDLAWSELNENQCLVAQGDGSLRLFDTTLDKYPVAVYQEHRDEVASCNWSLIGRNTFVSSGWDGLVKVWSVGRPNSVMTLKPRTRSNTAVLDRPNGTGTTNGKDCVYQAKFSPHDDSLMVCCSGDSTVSLFDLRASQPGQGPTHQFMAHSGSETLSVDFNKYRTNVIATGGVDNKIKIWDLRMLRTGPLSIRGKWPEGPRGAKQVQCTNEIVGGHELAVRKVNWSPHSSNYLLSTSYDMTCCIWQDMGYATDRTRGNNSGYGVTTGRTNASDLRNGLVSRFTAHTEFVFDGDWSLWGAPGFVATTGWDGNVFVWKGTP